MPFVDGSHAITAAIVAARNQVVLDKELADVFEAPVHALPWPFPADHGANFQSPEHDAFGAAPKLPEYPAVLMDLLDGRLVAFC